MRAWRGRKCFEHFGFVHDVFYLFKINIWYALRLVLYEVQRKVEIFHLFTALARKNLYCLSILFIVTQYWNFLFRVRVTTIQRLMGTCSWAPSISAVRFSKSLCDEWNCHVKEKAWLPFTLLQIEKDQRGKAPKQYSIRLVALKP